MNGEGVKCVQCGAVVVSADVFCESVRRDTARGSPGRHPGPGTVARASVRRLR